MAGRGPQTFKKRQKEQQRKEKQMEKAAKRLQRKQGGGEPGPSDEDPEDQDQLLNAFGELIERSDAEAAGDSNAEPAVPVGRPEFAGDPVRNA
jgi:hypothetical protein